MNFARTAMTAVALVGAAGAPAYAVTIDPVAVNASSSFLTYEAPFAIDGNPLTDWASNGEGASSTLAIDLGAIYSLTSGTFIDRTSSGGANGSNSRGITDYTTSFTLQACETFACSTLIGTALSFNKPVPPASPASLAELTFTTGLAGLTGQYFLYSVNSVNTNGANPGLAEVSFEGNLVPAVPEPATWALMILGFGIVGSALRRRSRTRVRFNFA